MAKKAEKGKKWWKKVKFWLKMVIFGHFWKSSKKNFNFALIRPPKKGRAQALKRRVDFWHFWIETIWESVLRVPIRLLLSDAFFFAPGGVPGGPRKKWPKSWFLRFFTFLSFFAHFWLFLAFFRVFRGFGHFGVFGQFWVNFGVFQSSLFVPYKCLGGLKLMFLLKFSFFAINYVVTSF